MVGCFLFAGLLGLFVFARRHHCRGGGGSWRGRGRRGRGRGRGSFLHELADELDLSPEQERTIKDEIGELRNTTKPMRKEWKRSRGDISDALRSDDFDAEMMGEMFARHDDALRDLRKGFRRRSGQDPRRARPGPARSPGRAHELGPSSSLGWGSLSQLGLSRGDGYSRKEMLIRALLIDDDARLFELLQSFLDQNGVDLSHAADGRRGLTALGDGAFDAVLLDVMMPGIDGLEVLRRIRKDSSIPVLMLTARGDEADRVVGLELGADDYISKPFSPRELLARLRAVLRRTQPEAMAERLSVGGIVIEVPARQAELHGQPIDLTGLELDILIALMRRAGRVVPRNALLAAAGRDDIAVGERTVDVHISKLRKKIGDDPRSPKRIRTVRGVGYVMAKESS